MHENAEQLTIIQAGMLRSFKVRKSYINSWCTTMFNDCKLPLE